MPTSPLELTRAQILAFRRRAGALDERLPRVRAPCDARPGPA
jgi:hypothetical protein